MPVIEAPGCALGVRVRTGRGGGRCPGCEVRVRLRRACCDSREALERGGFRITLVGHSLGAAVAAMLAHLLRAKGLDTVRCWCFGCPPTCSRSLADECEAYVTCVCNRDDVVTRVSPDALAALHKELCEYDWEPQSKRDDLDAGMRALVHVYTAVSAIQGAGREVPKRSSQQAKERRQEEEGEDTQGPAQGTGAGSEGADAGQADSPQGGGKDAKERQAETYQPVIPGRVLYIYRTGREPDDSEKGPQVDRALVDGECQQLRRIHVSPTVISDHLLSAYYAGLGLPNATQQAEEEEAQELEKKRQEKAGKGADDKGGGGDGE